MTITIVSKARTFIESLNKIRARLIRSDLFWTTVVMVTVCSEGVFAQQARVQTFFTRGTGFLADVVAPLMALACGFWGVVNIMNERPSGKQWVGTAGFLAIRIFRDTLQGWWQ